MCAWLLQGEHHHGGGHEHDHGHGHHDLNLRSAYLHVIADATTSRGQADEVASRLGAAGVRHVTVGSVTIEDERIPPGIQAAIRVYDSAMRAAVSSAVDVAGGDYGVSLASLDAPLIEPGAITDERQNDSGTRST